MKAGGPKGLYPTLEKILEPERDANTEVLSAGAPSVLYWLLQYTRRVAVLFSDRQATDLHRREPERERAGVVLGEDADEAF